MLPIRGINIFRSFADFSEFRRGNPRPNPIMSAYKSIIYSLDYTVHVYKDFGDPFIGYDGGTDRDSGHGNVHVLLSRRNQREWSYFTARRGCGTGCDSIFQNAISWEDVERVRNTIINYISSQWRSGEDMLDLLDSVLIDRWSQDHLRLEKLDFQEFLQAVNENMI